MSDSSLDLLAAERARVRFFVRRERQASVLNLWLTLGAVVGIAVGVALLLKPVSLLVIEYAGARVCLLSWLLGAWGLYLGLERLIPWLGSGWKRALHDRVTAEIRAMRLGAE